MEANQPRPLIPPLQPFCRWAEPISWALIRLTAGLMRNSAGPSAATSTR